MPRILIPLRPILGVLQHQPDDGAIIEHVGHDGEHSTTLIGDQNQSEGNVGSPIEVHVFQNKLPNITKEVGPRRSQRSSKLPANLNEFVLDNKVKYGLNRYANHYVLSHENYSFVSNLNKCSEPPSYKGSLKDVNWVNALNDEMHALYENKTRFMIDLPIGRKPIGCK
ncbi:hypothetical protein Tco_0723236 [Tanacetum coccineum]